MQYAPYILSDKKLAVTDTFILTLKPQQDTEIILFLPGQYVFLKNPKFAKPDGEHPFSITSSPLEKDHLEFCIKVCGDWTGTIKNIATGDLMYVSDAQGMFTWSNETRNAVFLLGGIGIAPVISMLKTIVKENKHPAITLLYGNRTPETVVFKTDLEKMQESLPGLKVVHIFSDIPEDHPWIGYRGFITKEILEKEVGFHTNPTFFVTGPPVFIGKMLTLLWEFGVPKDHVKTEQV